jgi:hypothetical protein
MRNFWWPDFKTKAEAWPAPPRIDPAFSNDS